MEQAKLDAFKQLFDGYDTKVEARANDKGGFDIKIASMYESPQYQGENGLVGLLVGIQNATGFQNVDIVDEFAHGGCETCDYGSSYGKTYRVW